MSHYPCMGRWGFTPSLPTLFAVLLARTFLHKTMEKKKSATHYTEVHFHAPVGQYIDYIENQTVTFDKDMQMHVAQVGQSNAPMQHTPQEKPAKEYCEYINRANLKEQGLYTLDEFEQMLANAAKEPAPQFAKFLKRYREQGNLDFLSHNKRQIFNNLRKHFPEMREYDYSNFAAAF